MNGEEETQIKICRQCHTIYKKFSQKYCGNNCQNESPFLIDGKINQDIEPREIILKKNEQNIIRWVCLGCHKEFTQDNINGKDFVCSCGLKNQLYPFTSKSCANEDCKDENGYHKLPIDGKACEKCGESNFILNGEKRLSILKFFRTDKQKLELKTFEFKQRQIDNEKSKNVPSLTFTILNNNLEYILYGENKKITMLNIIKDSMGYIPDSIYENLLEKYAKNQEIFNILYNNETQEFSLISLLDLEIVELDPRYRPKNKVEHWISGSINIIPENKLFEMNSGFFKIHVWVY